MRLGTRADSSFDYDDLVGDIDGFLIGCRIADDNNRPLDSIVREVRRNTLADPRWRFRAFFTERFGGSIQNASDAVIDLFNSTDIPLDAAAAYKAGFHFPPPAMQEVIAAFWAERVRELSVLGEGIVISQEIGESSASGHR